MTIKELLKSIKATYELISYASLDLQGLSKRSSEYVRGRQYNSYIRMSRLKYKGDKLSCKIRIPKNYPGLFMYSDDFAVIQDWVKKSNPDYVFSASASDISYVHFEGTKMK